MADSTRAKYTFLPYVRQGLAAAAASGGASARGDDGRLGLPVRLRLTSARGGAQSPRTPDDIPVPLKLYGPGDIVGIDPREIVRTEPRNLIADFEPHYFPVVEFDRPDFPWMFTPEHPDAAGRLRPWLCLVVVRKRAGTTLTADTARPLAVLETTRGELPDLADSWAWAHAQVAREALEGAGADQVREEISRVLTGVPKQNVSRLVCPRRLEPNTAYLACLVPTFEAGRLAGLGEPVTAESLRSLQPAWAAPDAANRNQPVPLPVYYHWQFSTGAGADSFETLVRRLVPRAELPGVGSLRLDVSDPGWAMPRLPGASLALEGALVAARPSSPASSSSQTPPTSSPASAPAPPEWPAAAREQFRARLRELLNSPATRQTSDPLVAPPIYGQWHAGRGVVPAPGERPHWLEELNLDPRYRVAAGLGTLVVRYQQEELMASAWEQIEAVERANQLRRQAQLAREVGGNVHARFSTLAPETLLQITEPAHDAVPATAPPPAGATETARATDTARAAETAGAMKTAATRSDVSSVAAHSGDSSSSSSRSDDGTDGAGDASTVREEVVQSALPETALSTAFRRLVRPRGPLARRLAARGGEGGPRPVRLLLENPSAAAPPRPADAGLIAFDKLTSGVRAALSAPTAKSAGRQQETATTAAASPTREPVESVLLKAAQSAAPPANFTLKGTAAGGGATQEKSATGATQEKAAPGAKPSPTAAQSSAAAPPPAPTNAQAAALFREAAVAQQRQLLRTAAAPAPTPQPTPNVAELAAGLLAGLDPAFAVARAVARRAPEAEESQAGSRRAPSFKSAAPRAATTAGRTAADASIKLAADESASARLSSTQTTARSKTIQPATVQPAATESLTTQAAGVPSAQEQLETVMAAPSFPQAMYQPLRDFHDMLLPGLDNAPPNTVALLKTNPRFIESYMVGLNHEMSRELLWREYPTDQRGTYFRQFWDVRAAERPGRDIPPIHEWGDEARLGAHFMRDPARGAERAPEEQLVLLIRGDLLRRYPNAIIYAVKAARDGKFPEAGAAEVKYPLFRGVREPDVTFIGFDLTEAEARGTPSATDAEAGWFFVLQEQPTEPRFGLDPLTEFSSPETLRSWRELSWGHVAPDAAALAALTYVGVGGPLKDKSIAEGGAAVRWGANAGHMARITLQRAYRVAIHAAALLP